MAGETTFIKSVHVRGEYTWDLTNIELYVVTFDGVEIEKLPQHPLIGDAPEDMRLIGIFAGTAFFLYYYRIDRDSKTAVLSFDNENSKWSVVSEDIRAYLESVTGVMGDPNNSRLGSILGFSALDGSPDIYVNHGGDGRAELYRIDLDSLAIDSLGSYIWYTNIANDSWIAARHSIYVTGDDSQQEAIYAGNHEVISFSSDNEEALLGRIMQI